MAGEVAVECWVEDGGSDGVGAEVVEAEEGGEVDGAAECFAGLDGGGVEVDAGDAGLDWEAGGGFDLELEPRRAVVVLEDEGLAAKVSDGDGGEEGFVADEEEAGDGETYLELGEGGERCEEEEQAWEESEVGAVGAAGFHWVGNVVERGGVDGVAVWLG